MYWSLFCRHTIAFLNSYSISFVMIRQPIVAILGHVDHGKTSVLDKIRGSTVAAREAGAITQAIGASIIPMEAIKKLCGSLLKISDLKVPGLLFIDTPGHAAFTNLRRRGGNLADIAILVVDINEGLMPQTIESIGILKQYKTPFVVALNKVDLIEGWKSNPTGMLQSLAAQKESTLRTFEVKLYEIVGRLFDLGFNAERFDRVENFANQLAMIPMSAKTGEGIPELLMMVTGLAQKFLEKALNTDETGFAKGTVLEVKEQKGIGTVLDVIIYDGCLKVGDTFVTASIEGPVVSKIKGLFEPAPMNEMREKKTAFVSVKSVVAAMGVRILANDVDKVASGMPLIVAKDVEPVKAEIMKEVEEVIIDTGEKGVIVKADSLGSLEAMSFLLKEKNIPVRRASIGPINKYDITDIQSMQGEDPFLAVILGFNIVAPPDCPVKVIANDVIYHIIEDYEQWVVDRKKEIERGRLDALVPPCKIEVLHGYVFRESNPAVVGVIIERGILKPNTPVMKDDGKVITNVKEIQADQETVAKAEKNARVAISLPDVTMGRQVREGDVLYSAVPEEHFRIYKELKSYLNESDRELLKEIASFMRKNNPVWGV